MTVPSIPRISPWVVACMPLTRVVRDPYIVELVRTLLEVLEDRTLSNDAEAYAAFRRVVGILAVLADEGRRR